MSHWSAIAALLLAGWVGSQAGPDSALEALAQAEARWQQHRPQAYDCDVEVRCYCVGLLQKPVSFRVRGAEVRPLQEMESEARRTYAYYETIENLFGAIRRSLARGQYKVAIEYDPELGYPVKADLDPQVNMFDDELVFRVTGFPKIGP